MKQLSKIAQYIYTITVSLTVVVFLCFLASCASKEEVREVVEFDPEITPSMITDSVVTLISELGITRYKLITDTWHVFDKAKDPFWFFPEGVYIEQFDDDLNTEATIIADTAWNYTNKGLSKLKGNVIIISTAGDEFRSEEIFWDQANERFYSDKYIEIKQGAMELKGYGFESNQDLTDYRIFRPHDGKYPFDERKMQTSNDSLNTSAEIDPIQIEKDSIK